MQRRKRSFYIRRGKRWLDFVLASLLGLLLLPVIAVIGVLVRLLSGSPVFFKQKRVGLDGKEFAIWKFRTMRTGAPENGSFTVADDARVTPSGKYLRDYKLDELPQLWNIVRGDMSFVGPRPDTSEYANLLEQADRAVLSVRPGLTGPATIRYAKEEELMASVPDPVAYNLTVIFPNKVEMNREYVDAMTLWGDLRLIATTVLLWFKFGR